MNDNKQEFGKGFSNSFILILLAISLLAVVAQSVFESNNAHVSFSYQLEHLVNLRLIQPEDSRKTALNENLVSFSGKFLEKQSDESKNRYKYLELLNTNHELTADRDRLVAGFPALKDKVADAAEWFLQLSGTPMPSGGYTVIEDFTGLDPDLSIVIREGVKKEIASLPAVERGLTSLDSINNSKAILTLGGQISDVIHNFRSPILGIGSESIKQKLREMDQELTSALRPQVADAARVDLYRKLVSGLKAIVSELNQFEDHMRLSALRSVRNYKEALQEYSLLTTKMADKQEELNKARVSVAHVIWYFNNQELSTKALERQDVEAYSQWFNKAKAEWEAFPENRGSAFRAPDQPLNTVLEKTFKSEKPAPNYYSYLFTLGPAFLIVLFLYYLFTRQMKGIGSGAMNFGKSPARMLTKGQHKVTFKDVAGIDEVIEELEEIVEFLRSPQKFTALGGHIPKGVLLIGPPGTGKTLTAKAVSGEADRPFYSISGSDFVEMFVGVGASRIRDLFDQAKKNAPCIIFMDEIDAVGRHRGAGLGGGHDEREQTLNQLLVEMDGFDSNEGVILMAATNRPDVLDKALLRPGRFDRRIMISLPDIKGRYEILKVHAKKIKMDTSVDLMAVARATPGSSGADLMNLLNEAALAAARKNRMAVTMQEITEARDKVLYGKERRSLELDENEKRTTAYHESGHTIVGICTTHADPVDKVTIIPRGFSLGATQFLPKKNRLSYWRNELLDQLAVLMGGRCAEEVFVGDISSGAKQDIEHATNLARSMICEWGMSDKLGAVAYEDKGEGAGGYMSGYHEKKYSEKTAEEIDQEVKRLLNEANERALKIIKDHYSQVKLLADMLMEFETLDSTDIKEILEDRWQIEEKRKRLKTADELHKKEPARMPPPPPQEEPLSRETIRPSEASA